MKTHINLYLDEFKPKVDLLGLPIVLSVWLLLVIVMAAVFTLGRYNLNESQSELRGLQIKLAEQRDLTEQLKQKSLLHVEDPRLVRTIEQQAESISHERTVLKALQGHAGKQSQGYAQLMADLANFHHQSIWLTGITYRADGIVLSGATTEPDAITDWLAKLSRSSYFQGTEFSNLTIVTEDAQPYSRFSVATSVSSDKTAQR